MGTADLGSRRSTQAWQLWLGLALLVTIWPLNWLLDGPRTLYLFFPLWLGYVLLVDGLVWLRKGTSLLTRSRPGFISLFLVSVPVWWLFELLNLRTGNWEYVGSERLSLAAFWLIASFNFSTVIPAVFETAELLASHRWLRRFARGPVLEPKRPVLTAFFLTGLSMLALLLAWPRIFFPLMWLSAYFIIAPINVWLGNRSLSQGTAMGDWRPVIAILLGALICGFFWEMWNFYSMPRWIYHVEPFEFLHIFEMPILGYGGYLPFGLELFAFYHLVVGLFRLRLNHFLKLG